MIQIGSWYRLGRGRKWHLVDQPQFCKAGCE
jgi:hypothetical protein